MTFPERCTKLARNKKPTEYLRQLYFDSLVFTPEALRHLVAEPGPSQIASAPTTHWAGKNSVEHIFETPGLRDDESAAILGANAAGLLGIKL